MERNWMSGEIRGGGPTGKTHRRPPEENRGELEPRKKEVGREKNERENDSLTSL